MDSSDLLRAAFALFALATGAVAADGMVPRPTPRPAAEKSLRKAEPARRQKDDTITPPAAGVVTRPRSAPPPFDVAAAKACEAELRERGVAFKVLDPIYEEDGCGAERPLALTAIGEGVVLEGGVTTRCEMALALDDWLRQTVQPSAKLYLAAKVKALGIGSHYQCWGRNGDPQAKLSEHAYANAVDISRVVLDSGRAVDVRALTGTEPERVFLAAVRASACAYFATVLGPGSDAAHGEHFHFDLAERRGGYRLCQ